MDSVVKKSKDYIELLKKDDNVFIEYLKDNKNFSNDYEVLIALCDQNKEFTRSEYFRSRKYDIIKTYINNFKFGKVIQNADNLVFVGSPYAMLLHSVGESVENDDTFKQENDCIQCFTTRFDDEEHLACFRSPHNSKHNISYLHNVYNQKFFDYFDLGDQIIALNVNHTDIQDRLNGCDFDSDSGYITNQEDIVKYAGYCYKEFPTIVNNIPKDKNKYTDSLDSYALVDNRLSHAQSAIGVSSNVAQLAQTYMYNFDDKKYKDYVCILSVIAQVSIDSAKRAFDIDIVSEIDRIKKDMNVEENGYPIFWKHIKDKKTKIGDKKFNAEKINKKLICPMNYLMNLKFKNFRSSTTTLPMSYYFNKFELQEDRRMSKKVERLIEKYSIELWDSRFDSDSDYVDYILLKSNFEEMIEDIRQTYISKDYLGLMSWLIDRAFMITNYSKGHKFESNSALNKNKSLLLKTLYDVNQKNLLLIFSKNVV